MDIREALELVGNDANQQSIHFRQKIGELPRWGRTQEEHDHLMKAALDQAISVYTYCQVRLYALELTSNNE